MVVRRAQAFQRKVAAGDVLQQAGRQDGALGVDGGEDVVLFGLHSGYPRSGVKGCCEVPR